MGCDETTSLTSLSWYNSRFVNSTHMASADSKFNDFFCTVSNFNTVNVNVNALIARELLGFTCTRSLSNNELEIFRQNRSLQSLVRC